MVGVVIELGRRRLGVLKGAQEGGSGSTLAWVASICQNVLSFHSRSVFVSANCKAKDIPLPAKRFKVITCFGAEKVHLLSGSGLDCGINEILCNAWWIKVLQLYTNIFAHNM